MCTQDELKAKEARIQQLKARLESKVSLLIAKVRNGTATESERKQLTRLQNEAAVLSNAS